MGEVERLAEDVLDVFDERGWCQFFLENEDGQVCALGAINRVLTGDARDWHGAVGHETGRALVERVRVLIGTQVFDAPRSVIADWNNDPRTTLEDVRLVFKRVAAGE